MSKGGFTPSKFGKSNNSIKTNTLGEVSKSQNTPQRINFYNQ
jgi:hypothetical protein